MSGNVKRRPVRAILGGIFLGLGVTLLLINFKVIALGTNAPYIVFGVGVIAGVAIAFFAPPRPRLLRGGTGSTGSGSEEPRTG